MGKAGIRGLGIVGALRAIEGKLRVALHRPLARVPFDKHGTKAVVDLRTPFGKSVHRSGGLDDSDFTMLGELLTEGDVFVDAGANVGQFSLTATRIVGPTGLVLSFEPVEDNCNLLALSADANGFDNLVLTRCALSDRDGTAQFVVMPRGSGLSSFSPENRTAGVVTEVRVTTIDRAVDAEIWPRVRMMKFDVEGAEVAAVRGAEGLIATARPHILVEIEDANLRRQGSSSTELRDYLTRLGYDEALRSSVSPNVLFSHRRGPAAAER